jgi:hypothetical protein
MIIVQSAETPHILSPNTLRLLLLSSCCHEFHLEDEHPVLLRFALLILRCVYLLAAHGTGLLLGSSMERFVETE